jgi:hypothetical protein
MFWRHKKNQTPCEALSSKIHGCASQNGAHSLHQPRFVVCEGYEHHFVKRKKIKCICIRGFSGVLSVLCVWFERKWRDAYKHTTHRIYIFIMYADWSTRPSMHCLHCCESWLLTSCLVRPWD